MLWPGSWSFAPLSAQANITPTSLYKPESIQGFTILINPTVLNHRTDAQAMRKELTVQLTQITRVVPAKLLGQLRKVRIWVEWNRKINGAAEFHPSADWLRQNGYNPDKAGDIEISNARNFVHWSRSDQPWMVMHELAHAYHFRVLGETYAGIKAAYQQAQRRSLYQSVAYIKGGQKRAYALTNAKEYFAELSEAYWGKNDFYPFIRPELKQYDPVGYQLMQTVWRN